MALIHSNETSRLAIPALLLAEIRELYESGRSFTAYQKAAAAGPLARWTGVEACLLAGRLANNIGAPQLARKLHLRAWRLAPRHPEVVYFHAWISLELRGPLAAWHRLRNGNLLAEAEAPTRADLLALQCRCACLLRDFQAAEKLLAQALQLAPDHSWIRVEEAFLRETEDRYDEALEAVQKGLKRVNGSWYRPAVQSAAHLLQLLGRDDEALILLNQAAAELENAPVLAQLFVLQMELHQYDAAAGTLDRFVQLAPLLEKPGADWVGRQRMRLAYLRKDFASAAELARQIDAPWSRKFADQLDAQKQIGRVQLPVQFVRQHHQTCAPATVAALVRFWNKPAEHLALAEAICYDGTPIFLQRQWAENHGWAVREFRLTWETVVQLIDRHVPFALATVGTGQGHMQAVIGYDACEQTLLLRDPWQRSVVEVVSEPFLKHQRSSGPRAMALVPREESDRISDLDLPDAAQYDLFHRLELNLHLHDRATGQCALEQLAERWPEHPITWQARRALATYDSNNAEVLRCLDKLLELYPHDANLQLAKVSAFRGGPRASLLEFLQRACAEKQVDPALLAQYAQELRSDAREYPLAEKLLERSFRRRPVDALSFAILGDIRWAQRRLEEATELYRFAACLEDKREGFFRAWFSAARHLKTTEEALVHLHDRFQRFGARSGQPACTLFWAYEILDQPAKAFALLDQAITLRPEDGELLCFTAEVNARWGRMEKAEQLVKEAEGKCHRLAWLRTGASVAQYRHDRAAALALWQQVLEQEPLDFQAHRAVAHLLAEANGVAATLEYLEKTCRQFPHHFLLHQLWLDWLRTENLPATEPIVRHLLELDPNNAWTLRELALVLGELRQFEEAALHLELALKLEPESPGTYCTRGRVFQLMGNVPEARKAFRKALEISVDTEFAINALVALCVTETERKEALAFIEQQLIRQVVFGDGLLAFRDVAHPVLSPETMLESLRLALKERPDLWHAWSALVEQLLEMGSLDEALQLAREAADRFPLLPRIWLDLARVQKARLNLADEIAALETALQINSGYALAIMQLVEAHERRSQFHEVLAVLQKAVARQPLHAPLRGYLADALWKLNRGDEALKQLREALELDPGYEWAWSALRTWSGKLGQNAFPLEVAHHLTTQRPGDGRVWLALARCLEKPEELSQKIEAIDRALALNPQSSAARDEKALALAKAGRFDEALAACGPQPNEGWKPELRARAAWIEHRRGHVPAAIAQMKAALQDQPGIYWAWNVLADWLLEIGDFNGAAEAASMMARLQPLDPVPVGQLAEIKLRMGERGEAKRLFHRALDLSPGYGFAGNCLFDLQMADGELNEAGHTLARMRQHHRSEWVYAREVQYSARRGDQSAALHFFKMICLGSIEESWPLAAASEALVQAGWSAQASRIVEQMLSEPQAHPHVGALWVQFALQRGDKLSEHQLLSLRDREPLARAAVATYIDWLAEKKKESRIRWWLRKEGAWLRADDATWAPMGYALTVLGRFREAIDWLADWRQRPHPPLWAMNNLVLALQQAGRLAETAPVIEHALALPGDSELKNRFRLWRALDEALQENRTAARACLDGLDAGGFSEYNTTLKNLASLLVEALDSGKTWKFSADRRKVLGEFARVHAANKGLSQIFWRSIRLLSRRAQNRWILVWGLFHHNWMPSQRR